jgi:hypothetical protein
MVMAIEQQEEDEYEEDDAERDVDEDHNPTGNFLDWTDILETLALQDKDLAEDEEADKDGNSDSLEPQSVEDAVYQQSSTGSSSIHASSGRLSSSALTEVRDDFETVTRLKAGSRIARCVHTITR